MADSKAGQELEARAAARKLPEARDDDPEKVSVFLAWNRVLREVEAIGKRDRNTQQNFNFRGIDAVTNAIGEAVRRHGITIVPDAQLEHIASEYETKQRTRMVNRQLKIRYRMYGPTGDYFEGEVWGEAADAGDKAMPKAESVAYRVFILQTGCFPTGDRDPDADSHERASAAQNEGYFNEEEARKAREELDAANEARAELLAATEPFGWDPDKLVKRFRQDYRTDLLSVTDLAVIAGFKQALIEEAKAQVAQEKTVEEKPGE